MTMRCYSCHSKSQWLSFFCKTQKKRYFEKCCWANSLVSSH